MGTTEGRKQGEEEGEHFYFLVFWKVLKEMQFILAIFQFSFLALLSSFGS